MSTHEMLDIEERLRAALVARAELVQPEDLAAPAPAVVIRPRWRSPWVVLAAAAVVVLVLGVVVQGVTGRQRSDDVAPKPDGPEVVLPEDVGRDWQAEDSSPPTRLDLDGDGTPERVEILAEPSKDFDGRIRLQTTLSSTGEEAYGVTRLDTTLGIYPLDDIDADGDGDRELVLLHGDAGGGGPGALTHPVLLDLRDGLLVEAAVEDPELLRRGHVVVPGSQTEHYDLVHVQDFWFEDGTLFSGRTVSSFARGNMSLYRPERTVLDAWEWHLDESGVLRPESAGCRLQGLDGVSECAAGQQDDLPVVAPVADATIGEGELVELADGYRFSARVEGGVVIVEGEDGRVLDLDLPVPDPRVSTQPASGVFRDGASFVVTSATDPGVIEVVAQRGDGLVVLDPVGVVPLQDDGNTRTWLTDQGALVTATADGDAWRTWQWEMVSGTEIAAMPTGTVCFDDVDDPSTVRRC
jgi:hypothetical protein